MVDIRGYCAKCNRLPPIPTDLPALRAAEAEAQKAWYANTSRANWRKYQTARKAVAAALKTNPPPDEEADEQTDERKI